MFSFSACFSYLVSRQVFVYNTKWVFIVKKGVQDMKNIAVLFPCTEELKEKLKNAAPGCKFAFIDKLDKIEQAEYVESAHGIIGEPEMDEIMAAGHLEWLQMSWSGTDKYTKTEGFPKQITLTNATGYYGKGIAEWLLGTLLALYKKLPLYRDRQKEHRWLDMGKEKSLYGKTVLIVGAGDIGTSFARLLTPFGVNVIGVRKQKPEAEAFKEAANRKTETDIREKSRENKIVFKEMYTVDELDSLLPRADVVALCLPDTRETEGMIDLRRLRLMKEDAVLLNAGRGSVLVTEDLLTVLEEGRFYGVGLDVVDTEPLPEESPLWEIERVVITPHISGKAVGHLDETYEAVGELLAENAGRFDRGEKLKNIVDMDAGYRK